MALWKMSHDNLLTLSHNITELSAASFSLTRGLMVTRGQLTSDNDDDVKVV